jgi:DNA (cytosine-5)-methyltransferase 1
MKFGSVCSGIEAASVAWHPLGWKAAWLSEIEPFPSAVLAHHYPDVPNLGDMTTLPERILSGEVEAPDLFCGGTPCQAFSVAGLRNSLDDARGNLSLTFCEIANAIDHVRSVRSDSPGIIFWENVPGVLSTKDNAFGCFLGALAGEVEALEPPGGKWTNAGCVSGPTRTVAWRVLDAQYFGVAQRRRRVFVVASARDDFDPAAVLFEFDGLRRDSAPSRQAREGVAGGIEIGPGGGRLTDLNPTLDTRAKDGPIRNQLAGAVMQPVATYRMVAFGEYSDDGTASAMKARDYKDATDLVAQPIAFHPTQDPISSEDGSTHAMGTGNRQGCATVAVAQPMPINTMVALRHEALGEGTGFGIGAAGDPAYTLTKGHSHAVAQPIPFDTTQITSPANYSKPQAGDPCHPLAAGAHAPAVAQPVSYSTKLHNTTSNNAGKIFEERTTCLDANSPPPALLTAMQVRRLTPVECERLQGFPDGYTNIPWRKKDESPDGPRYKALGNSWAVPNVRWIGKRIQEQICNA